jgi:hypothetical protein
VFELNASFGLFLEVFDVAKQLIMLGRHSSRQHTQHCRDESKDRYMLLSKREQAKLERRLITALTEACETAKAEIVGFSWLTHEVDYALFPSSLMVVWIFETHASRNQALACGLDKRMLELTTQALLAAGIHITQVMAHLHFDSEEQCRQVNAGDWQQRFALKRFAES